MWPTWGVFHGFLYDSEDMLPIALGGAAATVPPLSGYQIPALSGL